MSEKRKTKRLREESKITLTIITVGKKFAKGKVIYDYGKDTSTIGVGIHANIFLPIGIVQEN